MRLYQSILLGLAGMALAGCGGSNSHADLTPSRILFVSNADAANRTHTRSQLYSMSEDGSEVRQLTDLSSDVSEPAACNDGSRILFTVKSWWDTDIYVMDRDGSNMLNLTGGLLSGNNYSPCYCGTGANIVFESDRSGSHQIWRMDADGANPTRLTGPGREAFGMPVPDTEQSFAPDFSHDSKKIVYVRGENSEIWVMNSDGSNKLNLSQMGTTPRFNSVGSLIVFARDGDIYTMHTDGKQVRKLTANRGELFFSDPAFCPDGRKITFMGKNTACEIYVMDKDGGNLTRLTHLGADSLHPTFICAAQ